MLLQQKVEKLHEIEIFSKLKASELTALAQAVQEEQFPVDTAIVHENEVIDKIYLIISGNAEVTKRQKKNGCILHFYHRAIVSVYLQSDFIHKPVYAPPRLPL